MTLLDRFRTTARETHPDPAVRLAFVQSLPIDQREALATFAREDQDARVRRAAVGKLMDPGALGDVARQDADEQVRNTANAMLRDLALEAFEGVSDADSRAAVQALTDPRTLATIAKSALREDIAREALRRVADPRLLGSIARHASHESVRLGAFELLDDRAEMLSIALHSEFKDTALAAVERFTDRAELDQIAARAKNKSAAKRARAVLRERDEVRAREQAEAARAAEAAALAAAVSERVAAEEARLALARAREEQAARVLADQEAAARSREQDEAAERARQEAADREAAADIERKDVERRLGRLTELAADAIRAAGLEDLPAARTQFALVRREWRDVATGVTVGPETSARYAEAEQALAARDAAARDTEERARRGALVRLQHLLARIEPLAASPDLTLKAAEHALRDVRTALGQMPVLPSRRDHDEALQRLKAVQSSLTPKVQELREVADWQRWANVGIQEQLCEKMEALAAVEDSEQIAPAVRELQQHWRLAADVPRAQATALWHRFKTAHDAAWSRCAAFFAAQAQVRAENLAKKIALSERAESLADATAWIQTADELKRLQAEWKTIGPVSHGQEKAIWNRFRSACDRFFTRRQTDLAERKAVWAANLARKEALCLKVEALAESTDWKGGAAEIRKLQAEWKTIGPVKKSRSEAIWQRFRRASDVFFTRYAQRHDLARTGQIAAREAIVAELEAFASPLGGEPPADLLDKIRALRVRWQKEIAQRGVDPDQALQLGRRFDAAFARVAAQYSSRFAGTDLDTDSNRSRMEHLVKRMEDLAESLGALKSPGQGDAASSPAQLAAMLKEALAANTIGGKAEDEGRWRAALDDVRHAQASWPRIGPVPEDVRRSLSDRFDRACRMITAKAGAAVGNPRAGGKA